MKEIEIFNLSKVKLSIAWYDIWVGMFVDSKNKKVYICLLPCVLLTIRVK